MSVDNNSQPSSRRNCTRCFVYSVAALLALVALGLHFANLSDLPFLGTGHRQIELHSCESATWSATSEGLGVAVNSPETGIMPSNERSATSSSLNLARCNYKSLLNSTPVTNRSKKGPFPWIHEVMQTESSVMFSFGTRGPLSGFNYQVKHYACDAQVGYNVETVVCNLTSAHYEVSHLFHPAHFFQAITPCWSAFAEFPSAYRKIAAEDFVRRQIAASAWGRSLLGAMDAETIDLGALKQLEWRTCDPTVVISPAVAGSGWKVANSYNLPFVRPSDAVSFRGLLIKERARESVGGKPSLRLGILNRRGTRELLHTDTLIASIHGSKDYACIEVSETHNLGALPPQKQAQWVYSKDIVISPHGQQEIGFAFVNTCTVVLEVFPRNYVIPGFFLPFVVNLGGVAFGMHNGPGMVQDKAYLVAKLRGAARSVQINAITDVEKALPYLLQARDNCCRRLGATSMLEAAMANCL